MKSFLIAAALLFNFPAMAQAFDLQFKNNSVHATASFAEAPQAGPAATMLLEFQDATTQIPLDVTEQLGVILWMPDMGHGSRPVKIEKAVDAAGNVVPGAYKVTKMYFMMQGQWEVQVTLKDAEGNSETQVINLEI